MKRECLILVAASVIAVGVLAWPVAGGEAKETNQTQQIEDLLRERQAILQKLVEVVTEEYRQGTNGFESVVRATDQLIEAELELAKDSKARIVVLERRVELMTNVFSMVEAKFKAGQVTQAQVLAARAALLKSRIQLIRESAGGNGSER
jgi:outer membrane protein TolC